MMATEPVPVDKLDKALMLPTAALKVSAPVVVKLKLYGVVLTESTVLAKLTTPALLAIKLVLAPKVTAPLYN